MCIRLRAFFRTLPVGILLALSRNRWFVRFTGVRSDEATANLESGPFSKKYSKWLRGHLCEFDSTRYSAQLGIRCHCEFKSNDKKKRVD